MRLKAKSLAFSAAVLAALSLAIGVVGNLMTSGFDLRSRQWQIVALFVALGTCFIGLTYWYSRREHAAKGGEVDLTPAGAADRLAIVIRAQWDAEATLRRLNDQYVSVSWQGAAEDLVDWSDVRQVAQDRPADPSGDDLEVAIGPRDFDGSGKSLTGVLDRVPTRRLLVLGEPGAGKTVLLVQLVLDLLARRAAGGPVPILVSLASWHPGQEDLHTWLAGRLVAEHEWLATGVVDGDGRLSLARALLAERLVMPVLDGLDEIPERSQQLAIDKINAALRGGEGVVLSCRMDDYRSATRTASGARVRLRGAAGVVLKSLDNRTVEEYVRQGAGDKANARRWDPVITALSANGPVGKALRTPLMVSLANTIYNPRPGEPIDLLPEPAELCESGRFATPGAIQRHLVGAWVPAAYRPHPDPQRRCRWTADQAEHYLRFLARHLEHDLDGTRDLAWWRLRISLSGRFEWLLRGGNGTPSSGVTWDAESIFLGLLPGSVAGLLFAIALGVPGLVCGIMFGLAVSILAAPRDQRSLTDPDDTIRRDRRTFFKVWTLSGLFGGSGFAQVVVWSFRSAGPALAIGFAVAGGLMVGAFGGVGVALMRTAWGQLTFTRWYLAAHRQLPRQLMEFLADAHEHRGVLRRVGAVYQFRHIALQRRLASADSSTTEPAAEPARPRPPQPASARDAATRDMSGRTGPRR